MTSSVLGQGWPGGERQDPNHGVKTAADLQAQPGVATSDQLGGGQRGQKEKRGGFSSIVGRIPPSKRPSSVNWEG